MKKNLSRILLGLPVLAACLLLGLLFGQILFVYTVPMRDVSYDLSLFGNEVAIPDDFRYNQKGWTVFLQEGGWTVPLTANGTGGFTGLREPGQTFYFSRTMTEALDSPTLRLDVANQSVAVFLDDKLLYTDCPELDNRMGYLTLPMLDFDRAEPVVLSLPLDYQGKTLTIAQSTGFGEKQEPEANPTVWPCAVRVYCGYSYESGLISESFRTAIPAALCYGTGILLLVVFLWQFFSGKTDWGLLFLALSAFLWCSRRIAMSSFTFAWFGILPVDVAGLSRLLSLTVLLLFLASRLRGKQRFFFGILALLQGAALAVGVIADTSQGFGPWWQNLSERIGLLGLLGFLVCMGREWKRGNLFFRFFSGFTAAGLAALLAVTLAVPMLRRKMGHQLFMGAHGYFLWRLMGLMMSAAVLAALTEWFVREIARRAETKLLEQQYGLAQSGFENLRRHQEEVMMLRHDMEKHLVFLRQSTRDDATADYLEELIGQQRALSPVVQSRNRTLDIILNAKLGEASEKGIAVEVIQADAPKSLPLPDTELCALMMNLLDNAIHAACETKRPFLRLDMHQKDDFFVFVCENAAAAGTPEKRAEKGAAPQHGLGIRIIEQIVSRHGNLMEVERLTGSYRVTIALALVHSLK